MITIGRAETAELPEVLGLLNNSAAWLHSRGLNQWPHGFTAERVQPYIAMREVWLARSDDGQAIATIRATSRADPDFWTAAESDELAMYLSKLAVSRDHSGAELGDLMLRWVTDKAAQLGYQWVRLDAWRTNTELHDYYLARGWQHLRTVEVPGRNSGALFQRPAHPDLRARAAFIQRSAPILDRYQDVGFEVVPGRHDQGILPYCGPDLPERHSA